MRSSPRKTGTKVRDGKVQRKNRTDLSPHYEQTPQSRPFVDRQRPGSGHRHFLTKKHVYRFIDLLPDWPELSQGLNAVVLAPGNPDAMGWHRPGIVGICAWERDLVQDWDTDFVKDHREILDGLGVEHEPIDKDPSGEWCYFDENSIRGFQLMHIFLHELGHHHDQMSTRSMHVAARGESYAEQYAIQYADQIWDRYIEAFGW